MPNTVPTRRSISKITFNESHKLTDSFVAKAKPKAEPYFVIDTELSGFWLRVPRNTSQATYLVSTKPQGGRTPVRRTIGKASLYKAKEAREIARNWIQQIKAGGDPKAEAKKQNARSQKLWEAFEEYISDKMAAGKMGNRSANNYRNDMTGRLAPLMNKQIISISEDMINNWYKRNRAETEAQTDRAYRELNAVLNYQVALKNLESNPASIVKTLGNRVILKPKETFLNTDELGKIMVTLPMFRRENPHLLKQTNLLLFTILTGMRESTVYNLRWSQVTLRDSVQIETTKNGESYHLPLTPLLNDLLEEQRKITPRECKWVFPNKTYDGATVDPKRSLNRLYKEAGVDKKFSDHDLRRSFASLADLAKVSYTDIKHLMVHKKRDITEKYLQSQQIKARDNYERVVEMLARITPIAFYKDEYGDAVTHYATPDLLRYVLFNKGKLTNHPMKDDPDFLIDQSQTFYDKENQIDWD